MDRERLMEGCLERLLQAPELREPSEGTEAVLRDVRMVLSFERHATADEVYGQLSNLAAEVFALRQEHRRLIAVLTDLVKAQKAKPKEPEQPPSKRPDLFGG